MVTTTCIAAPLAMSVAELMLIVGVLVTLAAARAAVAGAAGEAVAASAAAGISAALQAMMATAVRRFGDRVCSCMVSLLGRGLGTDALLKTP
jgi:hypothetical protein